MRQSVYLVVPRAGRRSMHFRFDGCKYVDIGRLYLAPALAPRPLTAPDHDPTADEKRAIAPKEARASIRRRGAAAPRPTPARLRASNKLAAPPGTGLGGGARDRKLNITLYSNMELRSAHIDDHIRVHRHLSLTTLIYISSEFERHPRLMVRGGRHRRRGTR
ncbi:hypothetical protein EVAR_77420_1 [Eumeta japonica]|uniref:Uncharacterized protein n=1 Tax=Eumeta variegata TaxID=151549 RepID=A0A4C1UX92_EUMVA|nr:hypothetical protein EVAR_77420_1 [Eumeta japonica]